MHNYTWNFCQTKGNKNMKCLNCWVYTWFDAVTIDICNMTKKASHARIVKPFMVVMTWSKIETE